MKKQIDINPQDSNNNIISMSIKGKRKLLAPINKKNNQSQQSISTKDSINLSKSELDSDNDKKEDMIFLSKLTEREKTFFEVRASDIYNFLKDLNLIRYIESFINDGFETKEDLMEIQEDYFQENQNFNKNQQKKILSKAKELLDEYNQKNNINSINISTNNSINNNEINNESTTIENKNIENKINEDIIKIENKFSEIGIGNGDINNYYSSNNINRCWNCFNKLKGNNYIEIKYEESMITKIVRFCCDKCKDKFEMNIYEICDICNIKYDKSKGEYIYKNKHFHSQECFNKYLKDNNIILDENEYKNDYIKEENNEEEQEDIYDPMNDF